MESPFVENDWKRHLSINVDSGLWQCFKSGRRGNFISFYAEVNGLKYFRAQRDLFIKNFENVDISAYTQEEESNQLCFDANQLEPLSITSGYSKKQKVLAAWKYLWDRRLFTEEEGHDEEYYLCTDGKFANRIIIPFRDGDSIYYFQGRALGKEYPKYLNPSTDIAPKISEVLYPYDEEADHLVVCEGALDAKSLQLNGINATAILTNIVSHVQMQILSNFEGKLMLALDNDEAGKKGVEAFENLRIRYRLPEFYILPPMPDCKDWNEAHIKRANFSSWIEDKSSLYNFEYKMSTELNLL